MRRRSRLAVRALVLVSFAMAIAADARADGFLGDVEAGRAAVQTRAAATEPDAAARAAATEPDAAARAAATEPDAAARAAATEPDIAARAAAARDVVAAHTPASAGFAIGATLAALDADLAGDPRTRSAAERKVVEQQVRELLAAQAEAGIGNRALCLLSGRSEPKSLERQVRLVEPRWSCDRR